jgi:outer membrane lipoprotein SlyB
VKTINRFSPVLATIAALTLAGCVSTNTVSYPSNPSVASVGNVYSGYGVVYSIEPVQQQNNGDGGSHIGLGTLAGAVIGGAVGSQVGAGRGTTVATVVGAAGGAYVGHELENRKQETTYADRITVRMNDGSYQSLMVSTPSGFRVGDQVRIDNGVMQRY